MLKAKKTRLDSILESFPRLLVAYSGGVDSACLLRAAHERLGPRVLAVIADTPSLPREEFHHAVELAASFGAKVKVVETQEFKDPNYLSNPNNRCYFCKHALFEKMEELAVALDFPILAYGENSDDVSQDRPGSIAAAKFEVRAPLKEAGLSKADVRQLSLEWGLETAEKPASPCLSSRIPHGVPVTLEALSQIEHGEAAIRAMGFRIFRLRHHGSKARLEFAPEELVRAQGEPWRERLLQAAREAGYAEAEIDPQGYRSLAGQR